MTSRRRLLGLFGLSATGFAGCLSNDDESGAPPPDETETKRPIHTQTVTEMPERLPGETTDTPTEEQPPGREFGTVYDVVEQGADPNGEEPVDSVLSQLVGDDTLLQFPPGTYYLNDLAVENVTNFGMEGNDATLKLTQTGRAIFLRFTRVEDLYMSGFTIDNTAQNTAAWCAVDVVGGDNVIEDYTVDGFVDVTSRTNGFTIMVEGRDTSLRLENVDLRKGGINGAATFVFPQREFENPSRRPGSLTFKDCVMKGWGKEGLYASPHSGPIRVIGGEYANNAIVQVRVGSGNAPERAIVRDVTVTVDQVPEYMPEGNRNLRGIWLKEGDMATIENCDITLENITREDTAGALIVNNQFGRATIRDCSITVDNIQRPAIEIQKPAETYEPRWMPSLDHLPPAWGITVENVVINSQNTKTESVRIDERPSCTIRDVEIDNVGEQTDGVLLSDLYRCQIIRGSIDCDAIPVKVEFEGDHNNCVLHLKNTSLHSAASNASDEQISNTIGGAYCLSRTTLGGDDSSTTLALTRTEKTADATDKDESFSLYGRWLEASDN